MSNYRINNQDPATVWNLHFLDGTTDQLEISPELKENGLSIDWANENGTERYHGIKKFKSKTYNLPCAILSNSESDFDAKIEALKAFLITAGEFNLDIISKDRRYKVSYLNMTNYQRYGSNATFTLVLVDDYPTETFTIS